MPIPDYETLMLPVLKLSADGGHHNVRDAVEVLSDEPIPSFCSSRIIARSSSAKAPII